MTCSSVGASGLSSAGLSQMRERMFQKLDADGSGTVYETEFTKGPDGSSGMDSGIASALFTAFDTNGDGGLTQDELETGFQKLSSSMRSVLIGTQEQGGSDGPGGPDGPPPPPAQGADGTDSSSNNSLDTLLSLLQNTDSSTGSDDDDSGDSATSASSAVRNDFKQLLSDLQKLTESGSTVGASISA